MEAEEGAAVQEHRWCSLVEIAVSDALFVPRRLVEILPPEPIDIGV